MAGLTDKKLIDCITFLDKKTSHFQESGQYPPPPIPISSLIIENSHIGILIINDDFQCMYANAAMAAILGCPVQALAGSDCRDYFPEKSREMIIDRYSRMQHGEVLPGSYEIEFIRKDSECRIAEMHVNAVKASDRKTTTLP